MNLSNLRAANIARNAIWDPEGKLDLDFFINELGGEVGELCNKLKKQERIIRGIRGSTSTLEELAEEMADCVICLDLCMMAAKLEPLDFNRIGVTRIYPFTPSKLGKRLLIDIGFVGEMDGEERCAYDWLLETLKAGAQEYRLDLMEEAKKKFNSTSRKYNLPIFIGEFEAINKLHPDVP